MTLPEQDNIRQLTTLLRSSGDPFWSRLRELLLGRGVDPEHAVLAECFPDDSSFEFGIVVLSGGSVFQFGFDYLHKPVSEGVFTELEDLTTRFQSTPHQRAIREALRLVEGKAAG